MQPFTRAPLKPASARTNLAFRIFLIIGFIVIVFVFIYYNQSVISRLKENSLRMVNLSIKLLQSELSMESSGEATGIIFDEIIAPTEIPIIIADRYNEPLFFRNISGLEEESVTEENRPVLREMIETMNRINGRFPIKHQNPITGEETVINYFYYGDPILIKQLQAMPLIEIGLVVIFIVVGYVGYRNIKRSEQNFIWVGMAKETAHQLGTPISSLMGWLEIIKSESPETEDTQAPGSSEIDMKEITSRMENDVHRLQKIANRFSQIGSEPILDSTDLNQVILSTVEYFRQRLPYQGNGMKIEFDPGPPAPVNINAELVGWVFENLIKNSLEACDPKAGRIHISTRISVERKQVEATVEDNGRGIPAPSQGKIFQPGFTSKKRGWGLGLSLARRIIERHHKGRISLKISEPGEETVFLVCLPLDRNRGKNRHDNDKT
jgi:nitrogen-specific signal transduction histidine kinase